MAREGFRRWREVLAPVRPWPLGWLGITERIDTSDPCQFASSLGSYSAKIGVLIESQFHGIIGNIRVSTGDPCASFKLKSVQPLQRQEDSLLGSEADSCVVWKSEVSGFHASRAHRQPFPKQVTRKTPLILVA